MIVLLGATGYIGRAFARELSVRNIEFLAPARKELDYTCFATLLGLLKSLEPSFLINAAGYTGKPNVDACEVTRADTLQGNTLFAQTIAHACAVTQVPWGHVSSGCIFAGAKMADGVSWVVEKDLTQPVVRDRFLGSPESFRGFTEKDRPNFTFRSPPCSFYSGTKALGEEVVDGVGMNYIWRLRIPFDEFDNARNYLSKIQNYSKVYDNINSLSHRGDFVRACLDLWQRGAPYGIYNVTNPGAVATSQVVQRLQQILKPGRKFEFWANDDEFYREAAKTPRSNCILDASKLLATGVKMRPVEVALDDALKLWRKL